MNTYHKFIKLTISLTLLFASHLLHSQDFDVRQTKWGMTKDQIIEAEGRQPVNMYKESFSNDYVLEFDLIIESRNVSLNYHLLNGKLHEVTYIYFWGDWDANRADDPKELFKRITILYPIFDFLDKRAFNPDSYGWHFMNEATSERGINTSKCLGPAQFKRPSKSINSDWPRMNYEDSKLIEHCLNKFAGTNIFADYKYENNRTSVRLRFPLNNNEFKDKIISWITFRSNVKISDF